MDMILYQYLAWDMGYDIISKKLGYLPPLGMPEDQPLKRTKLAAQIRAVQDRVLNIFNFLLLARTFLGGAVLI